MMAKFFIKHPLLLLDKFQQRRSSAQFKELMFLFPTARRHLRMYLHQQTM